MHHRESGHGVETGRAQPISVIACRGTSCAYYPEYALLRNCHLRQAASQVKARAPRVAGSCVHNTSARRCLATSSQSPGLPLASLPVAFLTRTLYVVDIAQHAT